MTKNVLLNTQKNWPILLLNLNVLDNAEASLRRLNWYVNEADPFETFLWRFTDTYMKLTYLRRRSNVTTGA